MPAKVTKRAVDALTAEGGKEAVLWDSEVKGFGVRVRASGAKSYIVHYRVGTGRGSPIRKMTIGQPGSPWTPDTARKEAERILGLVGQGKDPGAEKQAGKMAETMADLCTKFMAEHVEAKRKGRTAFEYQRLVDKIIIPAMGKKKVRDVTRQDVAKLHHQHRATPYQSNRVLAVLSKLFNLAEAWGVRPDGSNPCRHVEKFKEEKRERMLSADELARLGDALAAYAGSPYVVAAVKLLVFTGARLREVQGMRWEWVDIDRGEARLPDSKTGAKTLHLPPPALAVLADLPRIQGNPFVIVGGVEGACLVDMEKPWRAIRSVAGLEDVRLHDLRHAFASVAACSGMALPIIGKMLGHTQAQTTQRYVHLSADPVKAAAATVAGKIADAMRGNRDGGAVVVPLSPSSVRGRRA